MHERRKTHRARTFYGGVIAFNKRQSTMDCTVRNFSDDGAMLAFHNTATIPDDIDLTIAHKERSFRARVIWRQAGAAGVSFLDDTVPAAPVPLDWARRLRKCEEDRAALQRRVEDLSTAG
jgi:hypothetical protein